MAEETKIRLFTALELPSRWKDELGQASAQLEKAGGPDLKPVRSELMHLTLVFLGYQPAASLSLIEAALGAAASHASPFRLVLGEVGSFGQRGRLQTVWVGLSNPPAQLEQLHGTIASELSASRLQFDARPLVPHITLGRMRRPSDRAASLRVFDTLKELRIPVGLAHEVREFVLMESILSRFGPEYEVIARFPLR